MNDNKYDVDYAKTLLDRHKEVIEITKDAKYPVKARSIEEFFGQKAYNATHLICSEYEEGGKYYETYLSDKVLEESRIGVPPSESVLGKREEAW